MITRPPVVLCVADNVLVPLAPLSVSVVWAMTPGVVRRTKATVPTLTKAAVAASLRDLILRCPEGMEVKARVDCVLIP